MNLIPRFHRVALAAALAVPVAGLLPANPATAQDAGFLADMPSAEQVLARFADGADPVQSLGRQCAALNFLERRFFRTSAIMTPAVQAHPATRAVQQDYQQAFIRLREQYGIAVGGIDDAKQRTWSAMCENRSPGLDTPVVYDDVLALLPATVVDGYAAAYERSDGLLAEMRAREDAARQAQAAARAEEEARARARVEAERRAEEAERKAEEALALALAEAQRDIARPDLAAPAISEELLALLPEPAAEAARERGNQIAAEMLAREEAAKVRAAEEARALAQADSERSTWVWIGLGILAGGLVILGFAGGRLLSQRKA